MPTVMEVSEQPQAESNLSDACQYASTAGVHHVPLHHKRSGMADDKMILPEDKIVFELLDEDCDKDIQLEQVL